MTRKEWMREHYPLVVQDHFIGGVHGCPCDYSTLVLADKSISICPAPNCHPDTENLHDICSRCWNHEIEEGIR